MKLGVAVRSMGPQSRPEVLLECVRAAEAAGLSEVWVQDHIAIPPDDAEGSGGRYLDPLTCLAWLAAATSRIGLGTGVLVVPYRPPLPTAKAVATLQELSGNRLHLGVGVGWMAPEFRALGVPRHERGVRSDEFLAFLRRCFEDEPMSAYGQEFLFLPKPPRPPIYVGGSGEHALRRSVAYGDAWMPMAGAPGKLTDPIARLRELAQEAEREPPAIVAFTGFDPSEPAEARERCLGYAELGIRHVVAGGRYADAAEFRRYLDFLSDALGAVSATG
ncbi:MAG: TIGR03619 family F420-dependent LLM class oxidoreductase [Myxococcales bacterium]|nr:TIGR03619 family F420-dependent LLM class oxidoreductase [Myxococcales bacterium]